MTKPDSNLPVGTLVHELSIPVRWGDMDALGHVNNIIYFQYFESTRLNWFETLGNEPLGTGEDGTVIVDNHAEYIHPILYPATLLVRMGVHSLGRSSFISTYTISIGEKLMTRGSAKVVWIDNQTMKSKPVPEVIRQRIEPATG